MPPTVPLPPPVSDHSDADRSVAALLAPDLLELLDEAPSSVAGETAGLHPADLAAAAGALPQARVPALLGALPPERAAEVLHQLDAGRRAAVLGALPAGAAAALVAELPPDGRADALQGLRAADPDAAARVLAALPAPARAEAERLLAYPPDTAGGLMTSAIVAVAPEATADEALAQVRAFARGRTTRAFREGLAAVYLTDAAGRLVGALSVPDLLVAPAGAPLSTVARAGVASVAARADREEVARVAARYDLAAVPVVDGAGRLLGAVTADDVLDAAQAAATEDVHKLGGVEALDEPYTRIAFGRMVRKRAGWLSALFLGEMLTATAMGRFEGEIARAVVLSLFIPLIISSGGNAGSQATSLIIRALALREVALRDWWRVAVREVPAGLVLGAILGAVGVVRIVAWQRLGWYDYGPHWALVAAAVGTSLVGVVAFGSLAGALLPFLLKRLGFDPASASAPFVATLVDVTGLVIYFSVAYLILRGTLL